MNMQSQTFSSIADKQPFQDHLATKTIILTWSFVPKENGWKLCLPGEWLKALFPGDLNNVQREGFCSLTDAWPFQDHLPIKLSFWCSVSQDSWAMNVLTYGSPGSQTNGLFKTILQLKLLCWLKALSARRPETVNVQSWSFPRITNEQPFQDHLVTKTIILTQASVSLENGLKLCLTGEQLNALFSRDLNNKCDVQSWGLARVTNTWTIFPLKWSYSLKAVSPKIPTLNVQS